MLGLRGPEQNVLAEQRIGLRFDKPGERLRSVILAVVLVAKRECGARTPNVSRIFSGKIRELLIGARSGIAQCASQRGKLSLHRFVIG